MGRTDYPARWDCAHDIERDARMIGTEMQRRRKTHNEVVRLLKLRKNEYGKIDERRLVRLQQLHLKLEDSIQARMKRLHKRLAREYSMIRPKYLFPLEGATDGPAAASG